MNRQLRSLKINTDQMSDSNRDQKISDTQDARQELQLIEKW